MSSYFFLTCYKPTGTNSYRLSATKLYNDLGGNSQNTDKATLDMYCARVGYKLHNRDQSGAEAFVVAHLCRQGNYRDLFKHGIKPHTYLALNLFGNQFREIDLKPLMGLPPKDLAEHDLWPVAKKLLESAPIWYDLAKKICHAATYCMGPRTFQQNVLKESFGALRLSIPECKAYLGGFFALFPEIAEWQSSVVRHARKDRHLVNLLGSPRVFGRNFSESYDREIISWIPQSTVGEITHEAVADTDAYARANGKDWNLVSNKHDSCATEAKPEDSAEVLEVMGKGMAVKMIGFEGVEFVMRCDAQIGENFGKFDKIKNPKGMNKYVPT